MAAPFIAAALCGSKSTFDCAAIFRSAHKHARQMLTWSGFKGAYRAAFAIALRECWCAEREAIAEAAYQATLPPIPDDVADRVRELHAAAWGQRITSIGNVAYSAMMAEARDLTAAARGL